MKTKTANSKSRKSIQTQVAAQRVLVPVDFSKPSLRALRYAIDLAADSGASLTLVYVVAADYGWLDVGRDEYRDLDLSLQKQAAAELASLADANIPPNMPVDLEVRIGRPAEEIATAAAEAKSDLIILATHGRTGLDRYLIGSVAERVAHLAPCPVYLMRPVKATTARNEKRSPVLRFKHKPRRR